MYTLYVQLLSSNTYRRCMYTLYVQCRIGWESLSLADMLAVPMVLTEIQDPWASCNICKHALQQNGCMNSNTGIRTYERNRNTSYTSFSNVYCCF